MRTVTTGRSIEELAAEPIVVAPMAGGPTTVALVAAAAAAGGIGFLAAGYRPASALAADVAQLRDAGTATFGVNVFVPGAPTEDPAALRAYVGAIGADPADARWDDDDWDAKVALLLDDPVPAVSFTFGCPARGVVQELRRRGTLVVGTVTTVDEALVAASNGVDALCVQGREAGAHRGVFTNRVGDDEGKSVLDLVRDVRTRTGLPIIAAGGIMDADDVAAALDAGAQAVQCGTAFLLSDESGAHATYRSALRDERFTATEMTRAFSGRPARGLRNAFLAAHRDAPAAYPEINNATRPLRAAAAAAGDPDRMSLWAGTGWRRVTSGPAGDIIHRLAGGRRRS
jgi:nitronate monooxygenase